LTKSPNNPKLTHLKRSFEDVLPVQFPVKAKQCDIDNCVIFRLFLQETIEKLDPQIQGGQSLKNARETIRRFLAFNFKSISFVIPEYLLPALEIQSISDLGPMISHLRGILDALNKHIGQLRQEQKAL
jgi:hypothetical protein